MEKDFDTWNTLKKSTNGERSRFYNIREIWWCRLGINVGSEQDGGGQLSLRPMIIMCKFGPTCLAIPLTTSSRRHSLRFPIGIVDGKEASALLSQVRVIDSRRLEEKLEFLRKEIFEELQNALRRMI